MTDDRFEQQLRGFLAAREPATVSPVLRARLQAVTAESPVRSGGWTGWLGGAWRVAVGLAAVTAVAVVLLAVLLRTDALTVQEQGPVGRPSAVPGLVTEPFVTAPAGLFTPGAVAEAERRLAAVFAATGVEATIVIQAVPSAAHVSTPAGWPERFDRDGNPDRDVVAVFGITPAGTPVCCLTLAGDLIERAQAEHYWQPVAQPGALDDDLAEATAEARNGALGDFVRGIEDIAPRLSALEDQGLTSDIFGRSLGLLAVVVPLLVLAFVALRRRPVATAAGSTTGDWAEIELSEAIATAPTTPVIAAPRSEEVQPIEAPASEPWRAWPAWPAWSDATLVMLTFGAIAGLAVIALIDLLLPAATSPRLDPTVEGIGTTVPGLGVAPFALIGVGVAALVTYAWRGQWRRRIGVIVLMALVGWTLSVVVDHTVPMREDPDRAWVTGDNAEVGYALGGLTENVIYHVAPGETFTLAYKIHNPGVLPMTILGLDGASTTLGNPHVASIDSLGWVVQPSDGPITYLSAKPEDASARWPVTLGPGEELAIVVVGRGGPCADADDVVRTVPLNHVQLVYRTLGLRRSTEVALPAAVFVTSMSPCTVEIPGGQVTYSTPGE